MSINTGQFNESYLPILDGVSITVQNYAYWLNKKQGKTIVVTPKYPNYVDHESFDVIRYNSIYVPKRSPYRLGLPRFDRNLKKKISSYQLDIIHAHSPFSSGNIALKCARERNIPIVATFHTKFDIDFKEAIKFDLVTKSMIRRIVKFYESVDYVFAANKSTIETLRSYGFNGDVDVIETGTDFIHQEDLKKEKEYVNHLHDIDKDTYVLLYVGQHIWQKNMRFIIYSLLNLRKLKQVFKMIFIGDGKAKDEMIKLVENYKLQKYVVFVGQISEREQLKKYYARADLFLFPSEYDTSGLVIREAGSFQLPSLVLKGTSVSSGIKDRFNGYLSENNPLSYAQTIISSINDRNKDKVGENAQQTLAIHFEKIIDDLIIRYQEIIKVKK